MTWRIARPGPEKSELTDDGVDRRKPGNEEKDEGMFASSKAFTRESEAEAGDRSSDMSWVDLAIVWKWSLRRGPAQV